MWRGRLYLDGLGLTWAEWREPQQETMGRKVVVALVCPHIAGRRRTRWRRLQQHGYSARAYPPHGAHGLQVTKEF
jgi:hypothetical protein